MIYCVHVQAFQAVRAVGDETSLAKLTIKRRQDGIVRAVAELSPGPDLLLQLQYLGCVTKSISGSLRRRESINLIMHGKSRNYPVVPGLFLEWNERMKLRFGLASPDDAAQPLDGEI